MAIEIVDFVHWTKWFSIAMWQLPVARSHSKSHETSIFLGFSYGWRRSLQRLEHWTSQGGAAAHRSPNSFQHYSRSQVMASRLTSCHGVPPEKSLEIGRSVGNSHKQMVGDYLSCLPLYINIYIYICIIVIIYHYYDYWVLLLWNNLLS